MKRQEILMADHVSDIVLRLVNSSPRTPTRDELSEAIGSFISAYVRMSVDSELLASYPTFKRVKLCDCCHGMVAHKPDNAQ